MNSKVLDESIAESLQTLDLMCFSEQYYFLVALISFGMLLVTMGVTTFINTNYNFFGDPVMPVIVVTRRPGAFLRPYAIFMNSHPSDEVVGGFMSDFELIRNRPKFGHESRRRRGDHIC